MIWSLLLDPGHLSITAEKSAVSCLCYTHCRVCYYARFGSTARGTSDIEETRDLSIDARGPFPADSIFNRAINGEFDVVLATCIRRQDSLGVQKFVRCGGAMAICENDVSSAAPCQCSSPSGMYTIVPGVTICSSFSVATIPFPSITYRTCSWVWV